MADTIFTVTVQNVGGANVYFINGVQQPTLELVEGSTYRLDQSDASNSGHPLLFSETPDGTHGGGVEYTTGVTVVGTPGSPGAYTQITVATSAPTLYYYCFYHSGMGGQANTPIPQTNHTEVVDSVSASSSIGSFTIETEQRIEVSSLSLSVTLGDAVENIIDDGWGAQLWGFGAWGIKGDVLLTGQSLATSINSVTFSISAEVDVQGSSLQTITGDEILSFDNVVFPDGFSISTTTNGAASAGGEASVILNTQVANITAGQSTIDPTFLVGSGWGRDTFGNLGWGVNFSVIGGGVNGLQANIITGDEDVVIGVIVAVSGITLQTAINSVGTSSDIDHEIAASLLINSVTGDVAIEVNGLVELTGVSTSIAIGDAVGGTIQKVNVQGVSITTFIGDEDITGNSTVTPTGATATGTVGDIVPVSGYDVTGNSASLNIGQVTAIGSAAIIPTGIGLTVSTINPNIIAWAEVDVGTPINWTPVDLAA